MEEERRRGLLSIGGINADPKLEKNSWETISKVAQAGKAADFWKVGDTKFVSLRASSNPNLPNLANYGCYVKIIGINHNESVEGKGIHFQFCFPYLIAAQSWYDLAFVDANYGKTGSTTGYRMNTSSTNSGGWRDSFMRNTICSIFFNQCLPEDLKAVIQPCTKYSVNDSSTLSSTTDKIWLLAEFEVFGKGGFGGVAEASALKQYDYYKSHTPIKYKHNSASTACYWHLRSKVTTDTKSFCFISESGTINKGTAIMARGFAPCFKV